MKNFRVLKTVREKGIISGFSVKNLGMILFFLLGAPYLVTLLFGNLHSKEMAQDMQENVMRQLTQGSYAVRNRTHMGEEVIPLELYVADKLVRTAEQDWEAEALKAQAILIRTELHRQMKEQGASGLLIDKDGTVKGQLTESSLLEVTDEEYGSRPVFERAYQAVAETAGLCVMYQDRFILGAYFAVSSGMTRSASQLELSQYPYLKSVICEKDFLSEEYYESHAFSESEFWKIWEEIEGEEAEEEATQEVKIVGEEAAQKEEDAGEGAAEMVEEKNKVREETEQETETARKETEQGAETAREEAAQEAKDAGEEQVSKEAWQIMETGEKEIVYTRDGAGYVLYLECDGKRIGGENFRQAYHLASADLYISREGNDLVISTKGKGHGLGMSQYQACQMAKEGESAAQILEYFFADVTITKIE